MKYLNEKKSEYYERLDGYIRLGLISLAMAGCVVGCQTRDAIMYHKLTPPTSVEKEFGVRISGEILAGPYTGKTVEQVLWTQFKEIIGHNTNK